MYDNTARKMCNLIPFVLLTVLYQSLMVQYANSSPDIQPVEVTSVPAGEVIENGATLILQCKLWLTHQHTIDDISWYFNEKKIPRDEYHIKNTFTVELVKRNVTFEDSGPYSCHVDGIDFEVSHEVTVGSKPFISEFYCSSSNHVEIYCRWKEVDSNLLTNKTFLWKHCRKWEDEWQLCGVEAEPYQPHCICYDTYCHFDVNHGSHHDMRLDVINVLGNATYQTEFNPDTETVPNPPENLTAIAETDDVISLSWAMPLDWSDDYHLIYTIEYTKDWQSTDWEEIVLTQEDASTYQVSNLNSFTRYYFRVACISEYSDPDIHQDDKAVWSDWSDITSTKTLETAPTGRIDMEFKASTKTNKTRSVTVVWKPLPKEESHGIILGYLLTLHRLNASSYLTELNVSRNQTMYTFKDLHQDYGYQVGIVAYNSAGNSPPSTLIISAEAVVTDFETITNKEGMIAAIVIGSAVGVVLVVAGLILVCKCTYKQLKKAGCFSKVPHVQLPDMDPPDESFGMGNSGQCLLPKYNEEHETYDLLKGQKSDLGKKALKAIQGKKVVDNSKGDSDGHFDSNGTEITFVGTDSTGSGDSRGKYCRLRQERDSTVSLGREDDEGLPTGRLLSVESTSQEEDVHHDHDADRNVGRSEHEKDVRTRRSVDDLRVQIPDSNDNSTSHENLLDNYLQVTGNGDTYPETYCQVTPFGLPFTPTLLRRPSPLSSSHQEMAVQESNEDISSDSQLMINGQPLVLLDIPTLNGTAAEDSFQGLNSDLTDYSQVTTDNDHGQQGSDYSKVTTDNEHGQQGSDYSQVTTDGCHGQQGSDYSQVTTDNDHGQQGSDYSKVTTDNEHGQQGSDYSQVTTDNDHGQQGSDYSQVTTDNDHGQQGSDYSQVTTDGCHGQQGSDYSKVTTDNEHGQQGSDYSQVTTDNDHGQQGSDYSQVTTDNEYGQQGSDYSQVTTDNEHGQQGSDYSQVTTDNEHGQQGSDYSQVTTDNDHGQQGSDYSQVTTDNDHGQQGSDYSKVTTDNEHGQQGSDYSKVTTDNDHGQQGSDYSQVTTDGCYGQQGSDYSQVTTDNDHGQQGSDYSQVTTDGCYGQQGSDYSQVTTDNEHGQQGSDYSQVTSDNEHGQQGSDYSKVTTDNEHGQQGSDYSQVTSDNDHGQQGSDYSQVTSDWLQDNSCEGNIVEGNEADTNQEVIDLDIAGSSSSSPRSQSNDSTSAVHDIDPGYCQVMDNGQIVDNSDDNHDNTRNSASSDINSDYCQVTDNGQNSATSDFNLDNGQNSSVNDISDYCRQVMDNGQNSSGSDINSDYCQVTDNGQNSAASDFNSDYCQVSDNGQILDGSQRTPGTDALPSGTQHPQCNGNDEDDVDDYSQLLSANHVQHSNSSGNDNQSFHSDSDTDDGYSQITQNSQPSADQ
ncbi:uncharacterized protein LOC144436875 [Glandiceps talaboti]